MGLEEAQVAEVYVPASDDFGSGYLVSPRLVLTARHVVATALSDRGLPERPAGRLTAGLASELARDLPRCRVRLLGRTEGRPFHDSVAVWWRDEVDAALLAILDSADARWEAPPLQTGLIWADLAGADPVDCLAAGFPIADAEVGVRESRELDGTILPLSQYKRGHWVIHGRGTIGQPPAGATSAWAGMSGAAVFADGMLIGVLRFDADPSDPRRMELWAEPARAFADDAGFVRWLGADGGPGAWTHSPVSPQQRIRLRGLTHGHGTSSVRLLTQRLRSGPIPAVSINDNGASGGGFGARLIGRGPLLADLHAALMAGDSAADRDTSAVAVPAPDARIHPRIRVLTGMGGVGKTSLAAGYIARYGDGHGLVAWLSAASPTALRTDFARLLGDFDVAVPEDGDPVAAAHDLLAARPDRWLLVFDNAPAQAELAPAVPVAGTGAVLITSVNPTWTPRRLVQEVEPLDRDAAVRLLLELSGDDDEASARVLADQLGGLPLALEQAGAYVDAGGGSIAGYLQLWRNSRRDLLARGIPLNHPDTALATWQLAVDGAVSQEPASLGLLRLLSCYAPNLIPLALANIGHSPSDGGGHESRLTTSLEAHQVASELAPLSASPLRVEDALMALRRYSLLRRAGDLLSLHRLVQTITLEHLDPSSRSAWLTEAASRLRALTPPDSGDAAAWPRFADLLPHAVALVESGADPTFALVFCSYLGYRHDPAAMLALATQIAAASDNSVSPEQTHLRAQVYQIEARYRESGDTQTALAMMSQLLPSLAKALGPDHPDTLRARNSIAAWTSPPGEALRLFTALLSDRVRVLGPDHPGTLITRSNLANVTGDSGNADGALRLFAALLSDRVRVLGPDHPGTLTTRDSLAYWTGESGDADGALRLYAALLPDRVRVLGPDHPDTLTTRSSLAYWSGQLHDQN